MQTYPNNKIPILSWAESIDENALRQAENAANHPRAFKHIAVMPDVHFGYGVPIGTVLALEEAVIPNAVGVDIGCGIKAVDTGVFTGEMDEERIKLIMGMIRDSVPVGMRHHKSKAYWDKWEDAPTHIKVVGDELDSARRQLGTLGGGNHFIELQRADDGYLWIMIHSGSRNFGYKIAKHFHKMAVLWLASEGLTVPDEELSFLDTESYHGLEYIDAMNFALEFAKENRARMMERALYAVSDVMGHAIIDREIDIHHNYATLENHYGTDVWVHRKGAIKAEVGDEGIVPGSMGTSSYITMGKGNKESFTSSSHGAGRVMGRMQASRVLTQSEADEAMTGIIHGRWGKNRRGDTDLGEAPQAYKDIKSVMAAQVALTTLEVQLSPMGVIKG